MTADKLLPCPFCGSEAEVERSDKRFEYATDGGPDSVMDYGYYIYCTKCNGSVGTINVPSNDKDQAISEWNLRTLAPDVLTAIDTLCRVNEYHSSARVLRKWLEQEAENAA